MFDVMYFSWRGGLERAPESTAECIGRNLTRFEMIGEKTYNITKIPTILPLTVKVFI